MDYSLLHKALVKKAVTSLKDAQSKNGKLLWTKHEELTQKKSVEDGFTLGIYMMGVITLVMTIHTM